MSGTSPGVRVQASTIRVRRQYAEVKHGDEGVARFMSTASPELRTLLDTPDPKGGWAPFKLFVEATTIVDQLFGRGDLELARDVGRFAAVHNQGIWKSFFMKRLAPSLVMKLAAGVWHHHYDGGRLTTRQAGPTGLVISIASFPEPHRAHCLSVAGWMLGTLEIGPRTDVRVTENACRVEGAPACDFEIQWK